MVSIIRRSMSFFRTSLTLSSSLSARSLTVMPSASVMRLGDRRRRFLRHRHRRAIVTTQSSTRGPRAGRSERRGWPIGRLPGRPGTCWPAAESAETAAAAARRAAAARDGIVGRIAPGRAATAAGTPGACGRGRLRLRANRWTHRQRTRCRRLACHRVFDAQVVASVARAAGRSRRRRLRRRDRGRRGRGPFDRAGRASRTLQRLRRGTQQQAQVHQLRKRRGLDGRRFRLFGRGRRRRRPVRLKVRSRSSGAVGASDSSDRASASVGARLDRLDRAAAAGRRAGGWRLGRLPRLLRARVCPRTRDRSAARCVACAPAARRTAARRSPRSSSTRSSRRCRSRLSRFMASWLDRPSSSATL